MSSASRLDPNAFPSGALWERAAAVSVRALRDGALRPIATDIARVREGDIDFLVRVVRRPSGKPVIRESAAIGSSERSNPFLPYDPALHVADVPPDHVCLLNKFNVVACHLLVVTRAFENQETPLTLADFEAIWRCLAEGEALAFYNSGVVAGASQPHKHLQLTPLAAEPIDRPPLMPLLDAAGTLGRETPLAAFSFPHAFAPLPRDLATVDPRRAAAATDAIYRRLLQRIGIAWPADGERFARAYNLLMTRGWMLAVPRTRECFESISCNAMAFVGAWLVRDERELELLRRRGPRSALREITAQPV